MTKLFVNPGNAIRIDDVTHPWVNGRPHLIGSMVLVADITVTAADITKATNTGEQIEMVGHRVGNWQFPCDVEILQGEEVWWSHTANRVVKIVPDAGAVHGFKLGTCSEKSTNAVGGTVHVILDAINTPVIGTVAY